MFLSNVKNTVIVLLVLGLLGSSVGLAMQRGKVNQLPRASPEGEERKAAKPQPEEEKPLKTPEDKVALLKARVELARNAYRAASDGLGKTRRIGNILVLVTEKPEEVYIWSVRWLQAERDLKPKPADQILALEAHLKRMTELKQIFKERSTEVSPRVLVPSVRVDEAEWYRLEAKLWLAEAKAK